MAATEAEYKKLRRMAEQAKTEHARAEGQLEAAMARLADEFHCATLEAAAKLQRQLDAKAAKADAAYEAAKATFEDEYAGRLAEC